MGESHIPLEINEKMKKNEKLMKKPRDVNETAMTDY